MSDSPPKAASGQGPTEATKEASAAIPTDKADPSVKPEPIATGALDDAAKAMDADVVKSDVPAPADKKESATAAPATTEAAKIEPPVAAAPKPAVDVVPLPATTSGMHQQYVAPGVARQSMFSSSKYPVLILVGMIVIGVFFIHGSMSGGFGMDGISTTTTGGTPTTGDVTGLNGTGGANGNNSVPPIPTPQADFTVNAAAIGDTIAPIPRMHPDGGTQNKGGYAEESADLDAAEAMIEKDPVKALQMVDQHDTDYPRAMLDPTARVIRVEAYAKKGDDVKALGLGNEFLEDYPHSPRAGRVMAIVEALKNKLDAGHP